MLNIGMRGSMRRKITAEDIEKYAELVGDYNPIHVNETAAQESIFGRRVVHGMFTLGLVSSVIGTKMPGYGTIYLNQNINFKAPLYIDDEVTVVVEVMEIINCEKGIYKLHTYAENQYQTIVIDGEALVKYVST
jgi:3-hydroxybutyryl-CoA dehydratase